MDAGAPQVGQILRGEPGVGQGRPIAGAGGPGHLPVRHEDRFSPRPAAFGDPTGAARYQDVRPGSNLLWHAGRLPSGRLYGGGLVSGGSTSIGRGLRCRPGGGLAHRRRGRSRIRPGGGIAGKRAHRVDRRDACPTGACPTYACATGACRHPACRQASGLARRGMMSWP